MEEAREEEQEEEVGKEAKTEVPYGKPLILDVLIEEPMDPPLAYDVDFSFFLFFDVFSF